MGRPVLAWERREFQLRHVGHHIGKGHRIVRKFHEHPTGERARGRPPYPWSALQVLHDAASEVWIAVQAPDRDARASRLSPSFPERGRKPQFLVLAISVGRLRLQRLHRAQDGLLVRCSRLEVDQRIAGEGVDLCAPDARGSTELSFNMVLPPSGPAR